MGKPAGPLYAWWEGDTPPSLTALPSMSVETAEMDVISGMSGLSLEEVRRRVEQGDRPYIARLGGVPAAYGWSATRQASIGELELSFTIPDGSRYLWDFVTLAEFRGRGIYPLLLRAVIERESPEADRYWIGHEPDNAASGRGIVKAGFRKVGEVYLLPGGELGMLPEDSPERARAGAELLGVRLLGRVRP